MSQIRNLFEVKLLKFPISPEVNIPIVNLVLLIKVVFADRMMARLSQSRKLLDDNEECSQAAEQTPESVKDKAHGTLKQRNYSYLLFIDTSNWGTGSWMACGQYAVYELPDRKCIQKYATETQSIVYVLS